MVGPDQLAEWEGDVAEIYRFAGLELEDLPSIGELALRVTGTPPRFAFLSQESKLTPAGEILIRHGTQERRATWLVGHEIVEWWLRRLGYRDPDVEDRANSTGAMLAAPYQMFKRAIRHHGHHVYDLAECFNVPQTLAFLRLGETTGRSVVAFRPYGNVARGDPYVFPARGMTYSRRDCHLIQIDDGWGMMAA